MATQKVPVLINAAYMKQFSPLPANYNLDEIEPFIHPTEKIWIEPILGTALYEELLDQVCKNEVTDVNSTLLLNVYPLLAMATCLIAMPFISYRFSEVGITQGYSENSQGVSISGINYITERLTAQVNTMKRLLKKFLDDNAEHYPLYPTKDRCSCECSGEDRWIWDYYFGNSELDRYDIQRYMNHCKIRGDEPRPKAVIWGVPRGSASIR